MADTTIRHTTIVCSLLPPITDRPRLDGARHRSSQVAVPKGSPQESERSRPYPAANPRLFAPRRAIPVGTGRAGDLRRFAQEFGRHLMALIEVVTDGGAPKERSVPTRQGRHEFNRSPSFFAPEPSTLAARIGPKFINLAKRSGEQLVTIQILTMAIRVSLHRGQFVVSCGDRQAK